MNISERQNDILKLISELDISPTLYRNAVQKYENITAYLVNHGIDADMYPQGSFALGTVVRPYSKDKETNYDLDFICQVKGSRNSFTPSELRKEIQDVLSSSDLYGGKLVPCDECFTIEYADVNGIGFSIDIVPATDEDIAIKQELYNLCDNPELINTAIAIPRYSQQKVYNWITNNPKGYRQWFESINEPFRLYSRDNYRKALFEANQSIYNSVEDIPIAMERSPLQRVIQILKHHRNVYYSHINDGDTLKPISAIINTVVTQIAFSASPTLSTYELLEHVLNEFEIYSNHQTLSVDSFRQNYGNRSVIAKDNGKWIILNPANPKDNLADKWNQTPEIARRFFLWINTAKHELIDSLVLKDEEFRAISESAFGHTSISKSWGSKYNAHQPKPISSTTPSKPWRTR